MTIAPADPASAVQPLEDAPGTAHPSPAATLNGDPTGHPSDLLRTLTELTADLPDADPGRVAAAALRGRSALADEAELRELATEAAAGLISEDPAYSRLAARLLTIGIREEAASQG
ncbi:ribonucleoside-diphosphate reductase subunit alpha, partial [Streptomyces sp. NPDC006356]